MKTAFSYVRISSDEQSNFSISGQLSENQNYAYRKNIEILKEYIDDGFSAKNFDRPNWKKLISDLKKLKPDYLLVNKHDRLIRNTIQGLLMLQELKIKYNCEVISVCEDYNFSDDDPWGFKMTADIYVNSQFERLRISDRTKSGIFKAQTEGRYIGNAPIGYINKKDEKNLPIIIIDENLKPIIQKAFEMAVIGHSFKTINDYLKENKTGFQSKTSIARMLQNPVYAGFINVSKFRNHPAQIIKAKHEAIISETTYLQVQTIFKQTKTKSHSPDTNFPLRGILQCFKCFRTLTGGKSKGRSAYYYYYRCDHCKQYFKNNIVHTELTELLKELSLNNESIQLLKETTLKQIKTKQAQKGINKNNLLKNQKQILEKIESLEEKFISNQLEFETYKKFKSKYLTEKTEIETELQRIENINQNIDQLIEKHISKLNNLNHIYENSTIQQKQTLLKALFPGGSIKHPVGFGTTFLNPILNFNQKKINLLQIKKAPYSEANLSAVAHSTRDGT